MNERPEQLIRALANLRLSDSERSTMRHFLAAHARFEPARHSGWAFLTRHAIAAGVLAVVLAAGATGVAAQRSRPGGLLYGVKTDVTDRVALAFETDELNRIERELSQAERMFGEEELAFADELRDAEADASEQDEDAGPDDADAEPGLRASPTPDELDLELRQIEREFDEEFKALEAELSL